MDGFTWTKTKRRYLEEVNGETNDFALCYPQRKLPRLDAEFLPSRNEEEGKTLLDFYRQQEHWENLQQQQLEHHPQADLNEETAIVLHNPTLSEDFPFKVDPDLIEKLKRYTCFKNQANFVPKIQENGQADSVLSRSGETSLQPNNHLAVVAWVPSPILNIQLRAEAGEPMESDMQLDDDGDLKMEIEEQLQVHDIETNGAENKWREWQQQQQCSIPRLSHNISTPTTTWSW